MPDRLTCRCLLLPLAGLLTQVAPALGEPAAVPPPIAQARVDCTRPQYTSDTLVCGDAELLAADVKVATLGATPPPLAANAVWEDHLTWFRRRSLCAFKADHRGCLAAAYVDRQSVLAAANAPAPTPLRCSGTWQGRRLSGSAIAPGWPLTIRAEALLAGVATVTRGNWQPVLALRTDGRSVRLKPRHGHPVTCRPALG